MTRFFLLALLLGGVSTTAQEETGRWGPSLLLDTKGVDIAPWAQGFVQQVRRNWYTEYEGEASGHVVLTFYVSKSGDIEELAVVETSSGAAFDDSSWNAIAKSDPTTPIPSDYPEERMFLTATFYYNERPPTER